MAINIKGIPGIAMLVFACCSCDPPYCLCDPSYCSCDPCVLQVDWEKPIVRPGGKTSHDPMVAMVLLL